MDALDEIDFQRPICFETSPKVNHGGGNIPGAAVAYQNWRAIEIGRWKWRKRLEKKGNEG